MSTQQQTDTQLPPGIPAVLLAAGKGTRMKAAEPKAATPVGGMPMAARVANAMRGAGISRIIAVVGHRSDDVRAAIGDGVTYVIQEEQLGTGHAASCTGAALSTYRGPLVIAYADVPLLSSRDIVRLVSRHQESRAAGTLLTAIFEDPGTLGRIVRDPSGRVQAIIESRDATPEQLEIREINVGVYCLEAPLVFEILRSLTNENAQRQYYLTDVIGVLTKRGALVEGVAMECADNGMGVDTAEDLARARRLWAAGNTL